MNKKLNDIFDKDTIEEIKVNKSLLTGDLLSEIRSYGNEGKKLALELLDIEQDIEQYYLDAFGNRISFKGNRRLKKPFVKLNLEEIHLEEIEKCMNDIHYFKDNYVRIKTKSGTNFPEMRDYQNEFLDLLDDDDVEDILGLMPRQSGKSISTGVYLAHLYVFKKEINIGIVANKAKLAREFLNNTKNILVDLPIWMQPGCVTWNKSEIESDNNMRIMTDVPSEGAFRGFSIHCAVIDEAAFIRTSRWHEFIDAFLPSQSALSWKKNIILSTSKGQNHFYELVKGASSLYDTDGSGIKKSEEKNNGYTLFKVDWKDVPRYDNKGNNLNPIDFQESIINKHGVMYWKQNYECSFLGSSATLISSERLLKIKVKEALEIRDGKLNIYEFPEKHKNYIMTIDPSKDGKDAFAINVIDITDFNFKQVASASLQIDYLLMPEYIYEWCQYYNNPYLIIENNEGAGQSIADQLKNDYEYENLHYDKDIVRNKKKKYPGFRTTTKTRRQILQTMKLFIENDKLEINDEATSSELHKFILINGKYQADDGYHDDSVMSLALTFAPFLNTKNFEDMKVVINNLYHASEMEPEERTEFIDTLTIGSFDDGTDIDIEESNEEQYFDNIEDAIDSLSGFY